MSFPDEIINLVLSYRGANPVSNFVKKEYPLYMAKKLMKKNKKSYEEIKEKYNDKKYDLYNQQDLLREQCSINKCNEVLQMHLDECKYGCTKSDPSMHCEDEDNNGRCSHFYKSKRIEDDIDMIEGTIYDFKERYERSNFEYQYELAKFEGRLEDFLSYDSDY